MEGDISLTDYAGETEAIGTEVLWIDKVSYGISE